MARTIYKYSLVTPTFDIPKGAVFLHCGSDPGYEGNIALWFEVNPGAELERRTFHVFGTGHLIEDNGLQYLGTIRQNIYMWHIYQEMPSPEYTGTV